MPSSLLNPEVFWDFKLRKPFLLEFHALPDLTVEVSPGSFWAPGPANRTLFPIQLSGGMN
jgi:hypothetical protein